MSDRDIQVRLLIDAKNKADAELRKLNKQLGDVGKQAVDAGKKGQAGGNLLNEAFSGAGDGVGKLVATLGGMATAIAGMQKMVAVTREFDRINAGLITATGSAQGAEQAFTAIQDFAAKTPYDLAQVTESFVKLVNFGLDPSEQALTSYGNTSSALGKDLNQMIEAVADAATFQFERLKEFGILTRQQGDQVSFSFRGVTTTVAKNAKEIEGYLLKLGETHFAGAMENRMKTLDGAISNLGDEWDKLFLNISKAGIGDQIAEAARKGIDGLDELNEKITSGELEGRLRAEAGRWDSWSGDVKKSIDIVKDWFGKFRTSLSEENKASVDELSNTFSHFPENVRAYVQVMTVSVAAGFDKVLALGGAFKEQFKAVFADTGDKTSLGERYKRARQDIEDAKNEEIDAIFAERDAALKSYSDQRQAAIALSKDVAALKRVAGYNQPADRTAQYRVAAEGAAIEQSTAKQKEAAKDLAKEFENGREALQRYIETKEEAIDKEYEHVKAFAKTTAELNKATVKWANAKYQASGDDYVDSWEKQYRDREDVQSRSLDTMKENESDAMKEMENAVSGWAGGFGKSLSDAMWDADSSFSGIAESFGRMITEMMMQYAVVKPMMEGLFGTGKAGSTGALSGLWEWFSNLLPSAHGNVFSSPSLSAYSNQVVATPTVFAFAHGAGVFGEVGPEAIMPLKRMSGGDLGVKASGLFGGGSVTNVTVINNTDATATTREKKNSDGGMDIEVIIDKAVAKNIGRHGSSTNKAVRATTGSGTQLLRR